jgi:hypothetical protein
VIRRRSTVAYIVSASGNGLIPRLVKVLGRFALVDGRGSIWDVVYDERSAMRDRFQWARLLAFVTGLVNQELLLRNEYLAAENRVFRAHLPSRLRLSDPERSTLAEIAERLGRKALRDITCVAKPVGIGA